MPRATSPKDALEYMPTPVALPQPKHTVGTKLRPGCVSAYGRKLLLRHLLRGYRKMHRTFAKKYGFNPLYGKLSNHMKGLLRDQLSLVDSADGVEIAGMQAKGMHVNHPSHESYLCNGQTHSGVRYEYFLLFRKTDSQGRNLVYIPDIPLLWDSDVKKQVIPETL
jgi:hypothetical protein